MKLRSQRLVVEESEESRRRRGRPPGLQSRCVDCNTNNTPMWRSGPAGKNTLCNACGLRRKKLLKKMNQQGTAKKGKSKKARTLRTRPTPSISTAGSTTNLCAANITSATANSAPAPAAPPAYGIACGIRSPYTIRTVRFVANNTIKEKKLRCFESKRTGFLYLERGWSMSDEQEAVAAALLELAGSALH